MKNRKSIEPAPIEDVRGHVFRVPTDAPEADGMIAWKSTTLVVTEIAAGREVGLGYTYASAAARGVTSELLLDVLATQDAFDIDARWSAMVGAVRHAGRPGVCSCAISSVDSALSDLKAKLLGLSSAGILSTAWPDVSTYSSGGFTWHADDRLADQLSSWVENEGCGAVKMKVGRHRDEDLRRVCLARRAIGTAKLYVDANGAFTRKQALTMAEECCAQGVARFEEPVSSGDLDGLQLIRNRDPAGMNIAAGEWGYDAHYFRRRGGGCAAGGCDAVRRRSGRRRTAPRECRTVHDQVRIERVLFDGAPVPQRGSIRPDFDRPGLGLTLKTKDARPFEI